MSVQTPSIITSGSVGHLGTLAHSVVGVVFTKHGDPWFILRKSLRSFCVAETYGGDTGKLCWDPAKFPGGMSPQLISGGWATRPEHRPANPVPVPQMRKECLRCVLDFNKFGVKLEKGDKTIVTNK